MKGFLYTLFFWVSSSKFAPKQQKRDLCPFINIIIPVIILGDQGIESSLFWAYDEILIVLLTNRANVYFKVMIKTRILYLFISYFAISVYYLFQWSFV